jgi:hypothetical protein
MYLVTEARPGEDNLVEIPKLSYLLPLIQVPIFLQEREHRTGVAAAKPNDFTQRWALVLPFAQARPLKEQIEV